MAFENFEDDYVEEDPFEAITLTGDQISFATAINFEQHVTRRFGWSSIDEFSIRTKITMTTGPMFVPLVYFAVSVYPYPISFTHFNGADRGITLASTFVGAAYDILLVNWKDANDQDGVQLPGGTYYIWYQKLGTTLNAYIYSDEYTTLVDTLTVVAPKEILYDWYIPFTTNGGGNGAGSGIIEETTILTKDRWDNKLMGIGMNF